MTTDNGISENAQVKNNEFTRRDESRDIAAPTGSTLALQKLADRSAVSHAAKQPAS